MSVLRAFFVVLCLGIVSFEAAAVDQRLYVLGAVETLLPAESTVGSTAADYQHKSGSPALRQHASVSEFVAAAAHSAGMMHSTGERESHCQTPCDNEPSCSSVCALACSPSTGSTASICAVALLPRPRLAETMLALRGADMFVDLVSPPLYRPPDHLIGLSLRSFAALMGV